MRIGILYICTGKYDIFWKDFYKSCERYFLTGYEKHYFVFTDSAYIYDEDKNNRIHKIYQDNLGWPGNTLFRFEIFYGHKNLYNGMDYLFFMNANLIFQKEIGWEIFPDDGEILVVNHPGFYNKSNSEFPYERNRESIAYIPWGEGEYYVAGGLNGGKRKEYLELISQLMCNIEKDLEKDIIAVWHDESHLNRYVWKNSNVKILPPCYLYPEGWDIPFEKCILIRDKMNYGGHDWLRGK